MIEVMDFAGDFYSPFMAVINYVLFCSLMICCLYVYWAAIVGQVAKGYKQVAVVAFIWVCILIGVHLYLVDAFGITLLVPPVGTPFFTEFMHIIQFFASIAVVLLFAFVCITALLKNFAKEYGKYMVSALLFFFQF